jgi:cytochrome b561
MGKMTGADGKPGYTSPIILLHWLMLILVAVVYALMELKSIAPRGSDLRLNMAAAHYLLGLSVFALTWARLGLRISGTVPPIDPLPAAWEIAFARAMHWFFYAFLIALPLLGWLALSAKGKPVHLFVFDLPFPIGRDDALAKQLKEIHETLAKVGYFAIGLHAAAALFHHFVLRDQVLLSMLPAKWLRRNSS